MPLFHSLKKFIWPPDYPHDIFILIFSGYKDIYSLLHKKDEDNIIYLKPQIRAISASSSGHNGFS